MYLTMCAHITFPARGGREEFSIRRINYGRVESSWEILTDTAELRLPRSVSAFDKQKVSEWIQRGDAVIVRWGYNGNLQEEFRGYVSEVGSDFPIVIKCEDEMYKLKQGTINVSVQNATLASVLKQYINGYTIVAADVKIGDWVKENTTRALMLEELKDEFGIYSFFKDGVLYSGITHPQPTTTVNYQLETNVRPDSNNLVYQLAENMLVQINASAKDAYGDALNVSVGDSGGEYLRKTFYGSDLDEDALRVLANRELNRVKVDGYKGSIETYGIPYARHGDIAKISSYLYPERDGSYYIKSVTSTFSVDGIKRKLNLESRA